MPQIQMLEAAPSFGSQLGQQLGSGLGQGLSAGLQQQLANYHKEQQLEKQAKAQAPFFKGLLNDAGIDIEENEIMNFLKSGGKGESFLPFAGQLAKSKAQERVKLEERKAKEIEDLQEEQGTTDSLNWLKDNIDYTGMRVGKAFASSPRLPINREAIQKREEYDNTGFLVADKIFTKFNKGVLNKPKFAYIVEQLAPNSELSERKNKARIDALERMRGLPKNISPENFDKALEHEVKKVNGKNAKKFKENSNVRYNAHGQKAVYKNGAWEIEE